MVNISFEDVTSNETHILSTVYDILHSDVDGTWDQAIGVIRCLLEMLYGSPANEYLSDEARVACEQADAILRKAILHTGN